MEAAVITGPICKAARALVEVSRTRLAENSNVNKDVIEMFERGIHTPQSDTIAALQTDLKNSASPSFRKKARRAPAFD